MQPSRSHSAPAAPWFLAHVIHLLLWMDEHLQDAVGLPRRARRTVLEVGGAALLLGGITLGALVGLPPLVTLSGGLGLAMLFVMARTWIVVRECPPA